MRVVIDTNVFVAALFGGRSRKIVDMWIAGEITLCLSPSVFSEYVHVLSQNWLRGREEIVKILSLLEERFHVHYVEEPERVRAVRKDPSDDKFVSVAVASSADYLVTADRAILALAECGSTKIVTPARFLAGA